MKEIVGVILIAGVVGCLFMAGSALAQTTWVDEIANSVSFYKASYPSSNWESYDHKLALVRDALHRGDQRTVKIEMGKWFKMLRIREQGISDVAADELYNFSLMVTPIEEYGISVPSAVGELAY